MCNKESNANHRKQRGRTAPNRALRKFWKEFRRENKENENKYETEIDEIVFFGKWIIDKTIHGEQGR